VNAVLMLKYRRMEPLAKWFAQRLALLAPSQGDAYATDIVVPVPLHLDRFKERRFNPAALLAKALAKALKLPSKLNLLGADAGADAKAGAVDRRAVGGRPWRVCHTARQPS
jgi:predicted amidophosphoribosyltransferase